jgi:hypothetical protein
MGSACLAVLAVTGCSVLSSDRPQPTEEIPRAQAASQAHKPDTKPKKHSFRLGQFIFYSDVRLEPTDPLFVELELLPDQIQKELRLPPSTVPVQIYLFDDQERYENYIKSRDSRLPPRPAYFFAEQRNSGVCDELLVFTWLSNRLRTDLRHELTHALLHGVLRTVPLWLDEGLAGYFELSPHMNGVNPQHAEALRSGEIRFNLARLEKLDKVDQMLRPEYQEAWGWVHFMLRGDEHAQEALLGYLQNLRTEANPASLTSRLEKHYPEPGAALAQHLSRLDARSSNVRSSPTAR